jgi:hypothetical protein
MPPKSRPSFFLDPMRPLLPLLLATAVLMMAGCGSEDGSAKADPAALEAAFKDAPAAPEPVVEESSEETTTDAIVLPANADVPVKEVATRAAAAIRKDDVGEALILLHGLRRARNLSPEQLTAVQDQMSAFQSDLARRAENGDQRAKQALLMLQQQSTRM